MVSQQGDCLMPPSIKHTQRLHSKSSIVDTLLQEK